MEEGLEQLRYPIGRWRAQPPPLPPDARGEVLTEIRAFPQSMREAVKGLDGAPLDTPYQPDGWTVRQTDHHLADSHINAYVRFRLALTENKPAIKGYVQPAWAESPDARYAPGEAPLRLLEAIHERWVLLAQALPGEAFSRTFLHPEIGEMRLGQQLDLYSWRGRHHAAHVISLRERRGW